MGPGRSVVEDGEVVGDVFGWDEAAGGVVLADRLVGVERGTGAHKDGHVVASPIENELY